MIEGLLGGYDDPKKAGLLAAAAHLLQQSGPSLKPIGTGPAIGGALQAGQGAAMQADQFGQQKQLMDLKMQGLQGNMQSEQFKKMALQNFANTLPPELQGRFWADPKSFLENKVVAPGGALVGGAGVAFQNPARPPAPSALLQLMQERDALPPGDPRRTAFEDAIKKQSSHQPPIVQIGGPQTIGDKKVDETFAKEYSDFVTGGYADVQKNLGQLDDAIKTLESAKPGSITGPSVGALPRPALAVLNPRAVATMESVEEVAQRNLRLVLGAQFTEKEGERLIARVYNPYLGEKENAKRVKRLFTQIKDAAEAKKSAAEYFEKNGTLKGWKGKLFTMSDFMPESDSQQSPSISPETQKLLDKYAPR